MGKGIVGTTPGISLNDVTRRFGKFRLGPVTASLGVGVTALLGANGAGKSTLMRLMVRSDRPATGSVSLSSGRAGYLPQDFRAPAGATVEEYLSFVAWCRSSRVHRVTKADVREAIDSVELGFKRDSKVKTLSGGMLRRLGVAQSLLGAGDVLCLDEPTVGLDPVQRVELRQLLVRLGREKVVVVSTHLSEDVASIAQSVLVLNHGRLVFAGTVQDLCDGDVSGSAVEDGFLRAIGSGGHGQE